MDISYLTAQALSGFIRPVVRSQHTVNIASREGRMRNDVVDLRFWDADGVRVQADDEVFGNRLDGLIGMAERYLVKDSAPEEAHPSLECY